MNKFTISKASDFTRKPPRREDISVGKAGGGVALISIKDKKVLKTSANEDFNRGKDYSKK